MRDAMRRQSALRAAQAAAALMLAMSCAALAAGCGWRPLYAPLGSAAGAVFVFVHPVAGKGGRELTLELETLLNPSAKRITQPAYGLSIRLRENITRAALRGDAVATRATMALTADFSLERLGAGEDAQGEAVPPLHEDGASTSPSPLLAAGTTARGSYDILADEYGALTSRRDTRQRLARELAHRIATRVMAALSLRGNK